MIRMPGQQDPRCLSIFQMVGIAAQLEIAERGARRTLLGAPLLPILSWNKVMESGHQTSQRILLLIISRFSSTIAAVIALLELEVIPFQLETYIFMVSTF